MLTEQRHKLLLELVNKKKSITVTEAKEVLNASESTIRRDIIALHNAGKLTKVFGGAIALEETVITFIFPAGILQYSDIFFRVSRRTSSTEALNRLYVRLLK